MAKVYMFPEKKKLPAGVEERLIDIAKEYVKTVYATVLVMNVDDPDSKDYEEVMDLIETAFTKGIDVAAEEMEKGL